MTGLAEVCAEEVASALAGRGHTAPVHLMDASVSAMVDELDVVVVVSSTYGHGDIPDNGQTFYQALQEHEGLNDKAFAVFALGDRTYSDTYCQAGEKWDALLDEKGATRLLPLARHDASSGTLAEDEASRWADGWVHLLS
jgi:flavodoxin